MKVENMTIQEIKERLPNVKVEAADGRIISARISGRNLQFASEMTKEEAYRKATRQVVEEIVRSYQRVAIEGRGMENGWFPANAFRQFLQDNGGYENKTTAQDIFFDYDGRLAIKMLAKECKKINFSIVRSDGKKRINYNDCSYQINIQPKDADLFETLAEITKPLL